MTALYTLMMDSLEVSVVLHMHLKSLPKVLFALASLLSTCFVNLGIMGDYVSKIIELLYRFQLGLANVNDRKVVLLKMCWLVEDCCLFLGWLHEGNVQNSFCETRHYSLLSSDSLWATRVASSANSSPMIICSQCLGAGLVDISGWTDNCQWKNVCKCSLCPCGLQLLVLPERHSEEHSEQCGSQDMHACFTPFSIVKGCER